MIFSGIPETAVHEITISFWVEEDGEKKFADPFWVLQFQALASETSIRVPFEDYVPLVPPGEKYSCCPSVPVVAELQITQADGSMFAHRILNSLIVE